MKLGGISWFFQAFAQFSAWTLHQRILLHSALDAAGLEAVGAFRVDDQLRQRSGRLGVLQPADGVDETDAMRLDSLPARRMDRDQAHHVEKIKENRKGDILLLGKSRMPRMP